jgi:hypothetical protein
LMNDQSAKKFFAIVNLNRKTNHFWKNSGITASNFNRSITYFINFVLFATLLF